ncbi:hypothetical protein AAG906_028986 [Vitis piasezkii]
MTNGSASPTKGKFTAMLICWILGIGSAISWNSLMTIGDYYYKLVLTIVLQPFALGTMTILFYKEATINTKRNLIGYILFVRALLCSLWITPYIGICAIVGAFGVASALVQGGMTGDLSFMCPEFIRSFLAGLAASGVLTSALRLMTKAVFRKSNDGERNGAMLFLGITTFVEFLCTLLYAFFFPKLPIVKFYRSKAALEGSQTVSADLAVAGIQTEQNEEDGDDTQQQERLSNKQLFFQNIDYALEVFLGHLVTLSIFPGFLFENTGKHQLGSWSYGWSSSTIFIDTAFYFTTKYGDQGWMILLTSFLGVSNGYLTVCIFTDAPKGYKGPEQNALGNMLTLCLLCGIFAGGALGWLWLIGNESF